MVTSQDKKTKEPFLGNDIMRGQTVQWQVEAEQRRVPRPRRLAMRKLQKRIVRNDALQHFAGSAEGG